MLLTVPPTMLTGPLGSGGTSRYGSTSSILVALVFVFVAGALVSGAVVGFAELGRASFVLTSVCGRFEPLSAVGLCCPGVLSELCGACAASIAESRKTRRNRDN